MSDLSPDVAYADDPVTDRVHHPYSAYNQGWDAADSGMRRSRCPYLGWLRAWWMDGYSDALEPDSGPGVGQPIQEGRVAA